jgi:hypothetical protein
LTKNHEQARDHASTALSLAERKGDLAFATRVRERLATVGVEAR